MNTNAAAPADVLIAPNQVAGIINSTANCGVGINGTSPAATTSPLTEIIVAM